MFIIWKGDLYEQNDGNNEAMNDYSGKWEQRWHPLRQEWVVYSAHRNARPWSGAAAAKPAAAPEYDPDCYLCPGNARIYGDRNPNYQDIFIFDNDHPVVGAQAPEISPERRESADGLYRCRRADGLARVVCYDPRHNVSLAGISRDRVTRVFMAWREQMRELSQRPEVNFVLIFENRGELVGVSNPHPHCQIYAVNFTFNLIEREIAAIADHKQKTGRNLFQDILDAELAEGSRIIAETDSACAFIPFFARYAYEVMVFPKRRHAVLNTMTDAELHDLADVFQQVIRRYDLLFGMPFPYVMAIYQSPVDGSAYPDYHLHLLLQPPLRRPDLQKFLAGPEIGGGNFMADTIPEEKAAELQQIDLKQYSPVD